MIVAAILVCTLLLISTLWDMAGVSSTHAPTIAKCRRKSHVAGLAAVIITLLQVIFTVVRSV